MEEPAATLAPTVASRAELDDPSRFFNRELSWLAFNRRVLALACDTSLPLLERVKFLAIFGTNLDEFFQVRVAGLKAQVSAGVRQGSADGRSPREQLREIREQVLAQKLHQEDLLEKELFPDLARAGIHRVRWSELGPADRAHFAGVYERQIFPVLTPLSVDPAHPFPSISNLSLNLAVIVQSPGETLHRFARLKVPPLLPRFLALPDGERFIPVEEVISAHLDTLFPGLEIVSHAAFRVTLDAELRLDESEADDLLAAIESGLYRRLRMNDAVRLEADASMSDEVKALLSRELELSPDDVYVERQLLDLGGLWQLHALDRPALKEPEWLPATQPRLMQPADDKDEPDLFAVLRAGDVLVHHPYDSFQTSVEAFLDQAADDPHVLAIKHTLYRTSGAEDRIVRSLMHASRTGKQVVALIELKARFDEESNIERARMLEDAGVHVVYGVVGLKTHGKVALVVRREGDSIRRYCHLGTGNYNPITAKIYEDVGLFTAHPDIGADVAELFNHLTGLGQPTSYRELLVAPAGLRPALAALIEAEAEEPDGEIVAKLNSVSDPGIVDALYHASMRGTEIDLVVRGICTLRPGLPGLSERIRVRSILGRFLEHSRIFRFGSERRGRRYFIGSADLMTRNLDRRVEVVTPVHDAALCGRLEEILQVNLDPRADAWALRADGVWKRNEGGSFSTQERFQELAWQRAHPDD